MSDGAYGARLFGMRWTVTGPGIDRHELDETLELGAGAFGKQRAEQLARHMSFAFAQGASVAVATAPRAKRRVAGDAKDAQPMTDKHDRRGDLPQDRY